MWFSITKMGSSQCFLNSRPSSLSKCMEIGVGLILVVTAAGSFSLGYIFLTSIILIVSTVFFTSFSSQPVKHSIPNYEEEGCSELKVECSNPEGAIESVAEKGVFQIHHEQMIQCQEGSGSMQKAPYFSPTVSEEESNGGGDDDDEDGCDNYVARSSLSSEDDGSISDEDTLIEIELPTGHYLSPKQHNLNSKQKPSWMELLSIRSKH